MYPNDPVGVLGVALSVEDVDRASFESGSRGGALPSGGLRILLEECSRLGGGVVGRNHPQDLSIEAKDAGLPRPAESDGVLGQRLEDRLEIEGGPRSSRLRDSSSVNSRTFAMAMTA